MTLSGTGIAAGNLLARAAHLGFFLVVGNRLGANAGTDAVFLLYAPLAVISSVAAGVAETVVMPVMHRALERGCAAGLPWRLSARLLLLVAPAGVVAVLIGWVLAGSAPAGAALLLAPVPVLAALSAILTGVLNAADRHLAAVLGPFWGGLAASLVTWLAPPDPLTLALALFTFEAGRFAGLLVRLPRLAGATTDSAAAARELLAWATRRGLMQALGNLLAALTPFIAVLYARGLGPSAVTCVEYSGRLWNLVYVLFFGHLLMAYAAMSRQAAAGRLEPGAVQRRAFRFGAVALPLSIAGVFGSPTIVTWLYGGGAMEPDVQASLASLLGWYLASTAPYIAGMVYVRALSAEGRTGAITSVAALGVAFFALAAMPLVTWLGLNGIGAAIIGLHLINLGLLVALFHRGHPWRWPADIWRGVS